MIEASIETASFLLKYEMDEYFQVKPRASNWVDFYERLAIAHGDVRLYADSEVSWQHDSVEVIVRKESDSMHIPLSKHLR